MLTLSASLPSSPLQPTPNTRTVAALFGLSLSHSPSALPLFQNLHIPLQPASILLITGISGSGKSTLLRLIRQNLFPSHPHKNSSICTLEKIPLSKDRSLVDSFPHSSPNCSLDLTLAHLARAGLSDAHLLLRSPRQLSEGQRFRYRLAQFFASHKTYLFADEFAASLDRTTAKSLAFQLHKFIARSALTPNPRLAFLATTHTDLTEDLHPQTHLHFTGTEIQLNPQTPSRRTTDAHPHPSIDN